MALGRAIGREVSRRPPLFRGRGSRAGRACPGSPLDNERVRRNAAVQVVLEPKLQFQW